MRGVVAFVLLLVLTPSSDAQCRSGEFECDDGECIDGEGVCDGFEECWDSSDEKLYNPDEGVMCRQRGYENICLLPTAQAGKQDRICSGDTCGKEFRCADKTKCISMEKFCDGTEDCDDGSDEKIYDPKVTYDPDKDGVECRDKVQKDKVCLLPPDQKDKKEEFCRKSAECSADEYACADGKQCIKTELFCTEKAHCSDGSDHKLYDVNDRTMAADWTPCRKKGFKDVCWLPKKHANKTAVCTGNLTCSADEFRCNDGSRCIPKLEFCMYAPSKCRDRSDLIQYNSSYHTTDHGIPCRNINHNTNKFCLLPKSQAHKEAEICTGNNTCADYEFRCSDHTQCIHRDDFCDQGKSEDLIHCADLSDEVLYNSSKHTEKDGIKCRHATYLLHVCLLPLHATSKADALCRPNDTCADDEFKCSDGSRCVSADAFCSGVSNCPDNSDELAHDSKLHSSAHGMKCRSLQFLNKYCLLPKNQAEKAKYLCNEKEDTCAKNWLRCKNEQCVKDDTFCDGNNDCHDGRDEMLYNKSDSSGISCQPLKRKGASSCHLPQQKICDGKVNCMRGYDECFCSENQQMDGVFMDGKCFRCFDGSKLLKTEDVCDGVVHCKDFSDECLCHYGTGVSSPVCDSVGWEIGENCSGQLSCGVVNSTVCLKKNKICNKAFDCDSKMDERFCGNTDLRDEKKLRCTGQPAKSSVFHECGDECPVKPGFCNHTVSKKPGTLSFVCPNGSTLLDMEVCNGKISCPSKADEIGCPSMFYCNNSSPFNIPKTKACDFAKDCHDSSDEMSCPELTGPCEKSSANVNGSASCPTHFYCRDSGTTLFIDARKVCDGNVDCKDGADECQSWCITSAFSDQWSLIAQPGFLPFIWIISMLALFGNLIVMGYSGRDVFCPRKPLSQREKGQEILVLNLALADFLVGVYTASICIQNVNLSYGKGYCLVDQAWRSSDSCTALGVILVLGSEASVLALTLITIFRLKAVMRPFGGTHVPLYWCLLALAWVLSLAVALIPIADSLENYFVESIWYAQNPLFASIRRENVTDLSKHLMVLQDKNESFITEYGSLGSWSLVKKLISNLNPAYTPDRKFGYYSAHGVCLPRLFPDASIVEAWGYSFFLIFINFLSFLFIFLGYVLIFKQATRATSMKASGAEKAAALQRKVTRIVVTDFLCWMPICVMVILQVAGVDIGEDVYVPVGTILIPINSALNPFLYSNAPEWLWKLISPLCPCLKSKDEVDSTTQSNTQSANSKNRTKATNLQSGSDVVSSRPSTPGYPEDDQKTALASSSKRGSQGDMLEMSVQVNS